MVAKTPTILATSGGFQLGARTDLAPAALFHYAVELAEPVGRPKVCYLGTASGDQRAGTARIYDAFVDSDVELSHLHLFPMPNVADIRSHLLDQDMIWVGGGSVAGLLALWRLHGLDEIFREVWQAGVVLAGVSAGSICWHQGGPTDSFGPQLQGVTNGLGLLPYGNGVHYDSEGQRRPLLHHMVSSGTFDVAYATEDGTGVLYRGTEFIEALSERPDKSAYRVWRDASGEVREETLPTRLLET